MTPLDDSEFLAEVIALYRAGDGAYSRGFLAAAICRELGRRLRRAEAADTEADDADTTAAEELLREDRTLVDDALKALDSRSILEDLTRYVRAHPLGDDEEEGFRLLVTLDGFHLVALVAERFPPTAAAVRARAALHKALDVLGSVVTSNLPAFGPAAATTDEYCLEWGVEEDSPLTRVGAMDAPDLALLAEERGRAPAIPGEVRPDCLDANAIVALAEGLGGQPARAHVAGCVRCAALVSAAVRDLADSPLGFWEKVRGCLDPLVTWAIAEPTGRLVSAVTQAAKDLLSQPADLIPVGAAASGGRAKELPVLLVDARGRARGRTRATVLTMPRIERGRFRMALRLPDTDLSGARGWVSVRLAGERFLVVPGRVVGARLGVHATGLAGSRVISLDAVDVAVAAPQQRRRPRGSRRTKGR